MKNAVVYAVSGAHIMLVASSMASLIDHYESREPLDILVMSEKLRPGDVSLIREIPKMYPGKAPISVFVWAAPGIMQQLKDYHNERFPQVVLWRLFAASAFSSYARIVYLDNDTVVCDDISPMFDTVDQDHPVAAVKDFYFQIHQGGTTYFNSGVLVFDTAAFNQTVTPQKLIDLVNTTSYRYPDQSILNQVFEGKIHYLSYRYNFQKNDLWINNWAMKQNADLTQAIVDERSHTVIRHFVEYEMNSMPWQHLAVYDSFEQKFWEYQAQVHHFFNERSIALGLNDDEK